MSFESSPCFFPGGLHSISVDITESTTIVPTKTSYITFFLWNEGKIVSPYCVGINLNSSQKLGCIFGESKPRAEAGESPKTDLI